ncbi:hypothetical protein cyc_00674 [Cyclospora cayetanensis]|uniref:Uncharacterized protein n=1 Tax=Cyclospora cayetanensis TaxID=88456 RepID=A0A1D3CR96_9EIME|nr:hypothetical protein cyc_00674 [Cyclospora cayetanensis]
MCRTCCVRDFADAAALLEAEEKGSAPPLGSTPDGADLERQILALAERAAEEALLEDSEVSGGSLYDDDADEELLLAQAAAAPFSPAETEAEESSSEEEKCKEVPAPGMFLLGDSFESVICLPPG